MRAFWIISLLIALAVGSPTKSRVVDKEVKEDIVAKPSENATPAEVVEIAKESIDKSETPVATDAIVESANASNSNLTRDIGAIGQGCTLCKCGSSNKDKNGGKEGTVDEFPWHASLYVKGHFIDCSGTLINNKYVLTAAHCVSDLNEDERRGLYVRFLVPSLHDTNDKTIQRGVSNCIVHESFELKTRNNDIALLELDEKVKLSLTSNVRPLCLPSESSNDFHGNHGIVTGHSWDKGDRIFSKHLERKDVDIISGSKCKFDTDHLFSKHSHIHEDNHICAGTNGHHKASNCLKDSGAPLQVLSAGTFKNRYELAGIVSSHQDCSDLNKPSIYTKVTNYVKWIEHHTFDACSCVL